MIPVVAREVLESNALAHFTTLDEKGAPYVTRITVGRIGGVGPWAEGRS